MRVGTLLHRLLGIVLGLALGLSLSARNLERFLDAPRPQGDGIRLVVFNPTVHNIRCLAALREKGRIGTCRSVRVNFVPFACRLQGARWDTGEYAFAANTTTKICVR